MSRAALAVAAIVVAGTIGYGLLGGLVRGPSVFDDELAYMEGTRAIADGHRPVIRDRPFGRGVLVPLVNAPAFAAAPDARTGYRAVRWLNAFLFSLTAVPAFLLAWRVLGRPASLAVAALSVAVPSGLYTALIMSETLAYLTGTLALLAAALALERPTLRRQLAALGAVGLAATARPQLAVLAFVLPLAVGADWLVRRKHGGPDLRQAFRPLWPTAAALGIVGLALAVSLALGHLPAKDYRSVYRSYDVLSVLKWSWYTLADLGLYLALLPLVAAPAALAALWRGGERAPGEGAFAGLFVAANVLTIGVVAVFSAAPFSGDRAHDRYVFYLVPLWLVLFAVFLERGAQASRRLLLAGSALTLALLATFPPRLVTHDGNYQFDAMATGIWSRIRDIEPTRPSLVRATLCLAALAAAAALWSLRLWLRPGRLVALLLIAAVFVANGAIIWPMRIHDADRDVFADNRGSTWSWVDRAVPPGRTVADVYVDSGDCLRLLDSYRWTEFFNDRIGPVYRLGLPPAPGILIDGNDSRILPGGLVRTKAGKPIRPDYAVAEPGLVLRGRRVAEGTTSRLQLWKLDGELQVTNLHSNAEAVERTCRSASS